MYEAVFTNAVGSATTTTATLDVQTLPSVTLSPSNDTVTAGATATFTATATGNPSPTVQWYDSIDGGAFMALSGATSTTLSFTSTASDDGNVYEAVFTNAVGSATTTAATLDVQTSAPTVTMPSITLSPSNDTVTAGQTATFTATATGTPNPTVQWYDSTDNGATFTALSGATSTTLTFTTAAGDNGNLYEAVFTNSVGSATTTAASLDVQTVPTFTSGTPTAGVTAGQTYSFTFTAAGTPSPTLTASNLPSWLTFNAATGILSGSSTLAMTYSNLDIIATNAAGSATQTFNLTVNPAAASQFVVSTPTSGATGTPFSVTCHRRGHVRQRSPRATTAAFRSATRMA